MSRSDQMGDYSINRSRMIVMRAVVRRLTSFERFICERENLVFDFSFILSQWRDLRIEVML